MTNAERIIDAIKKAEGKYYDEILYYVPCPSRMYQNNIKRCVEIHDCRTCKRKWMAEEAKEEEPERGYLDPLNYFEEYEG